MTSYTFTMSAPNIVMTPAQNYGNIYFAGVPLETEGNAVSTDRLGSVRNGGGAGYQAEYPYGVEYSLTSNDREKYATYTRDSITGLDYAVNRYYWSQWGRFLSPDPHTGGAVRPADPGSWNGYSYTRSDPINRGDPSGLDDCPLPCLAFTPYPDPDDPTLGGVNYLGGDGSGYLNPFRFQILLPDPTAIGGNFKTLTQLFLVPAVLGAESLLENNPPCDQLFSSGAPFNDPATVLQSAYANNQIRLVPFDSSAIPLDVGAETTGINGTIYIASNRYFVTGILASGAPITQATSPNFQGLTLSQIDSLILIHELLHFTGAVGDDDNGQAITLANGVKVYGSFGVSNEVRKDCLH